MGRTIEPTRPEDLAELGRFLAEGFHAPAGAEFAAADVLAWKYFAPMGAAGPRSFVAREGGAIVGHVGICPTAFRVVGDGARDVPALHMMDWLGSAGHPGVGSSLMRRVHGLMPLQYGFGGSAAGRRVIRGGGYELTAEVPVFRKVLRPLHRLRDPGVGPVRRLLGAARDAARAARGRGRPPRTPLAVRRVGRFGGAIEAIVAGAEGPVIFTDRSPERLDWLLGYPRGGMSGWLVEGGRGFALLNLAARDGVRVGRVVECFLPGRDPDAWHAAVAALATELRREGADVITCCGSTPWMAAALEAAGFAPAHALDFSLRDRPGLVPRDRPFHLSFLEADYAYS